MNATRLATEAIQAAIRTATGELLVPGSDRLQLLLQLRNEIDQLLREQFPEAASALADAGVMAR